MEVKLKLLAILSLATESHLLILENRNASIIKCLQTHLSKAVEINFLIISSRKNNFTPIEKYTTNIIYNIANFSGSEYQKYSQIIIEVNSIDEFVQILGVMSSNNATFNPRSKFLVIFFGSTGIEEMFHHSWRYFIVNIVVLLADGTVYTYFPYHQGRCGQVILAEVLGTCRNVSDLFPNKIPNDLGGCEVKFMPYPMIPYVINVSESREDPSKAGLEVTIVNALAKKINFKDVYVPCPHIIWGFKNKSGKYTYMFGSLFNNEMDFIVGMTYGNASHIVDFDGSFIYLMEETVWWVPAALPIAQWKNLTAIFEDKLWLTIFLAFFINGFSWWCIGRKRENSSDFNEITLCLMGSLYCLLQGSVGAPKKWNLRMVFILWLLTCLLLFTAHQSSLVSILTTPLYDRQISTVEDIINSKLSFGFYIGALTAFEDTDNWISRIIYKNFIQCPLSLYCVNRTAFDRDFAYFKNSRNTKYFIPRFYTFPNGRQMIFQLDASGVGVWIRLHVKKGLPFLERINDILMLLQSNGLIEKWDKDTNYKIIKIESSDHESLTMKHLQGAFFILSFGLGISFLVFLCEIFWGKGKSKHVQFNQ